MGLRLEIYPNELGNIVIQRNTDPKVVLEKKFVKLLGQGYTPQSDKTYRDIENRLLFDLNLALTLSFIYRDPSPERASNMIYFSGNKPASLKEVLTEVFTASGESEIWSYRFYGLLFAHIIKQRLHAVYES